MLQYQKYPAPLKGPSQTSTLRRYRAVYTDSSLNPIILTVWCILYFSLNGPLTWKTLDKDFIGEVWQRLLLYFWILTRELWCNCHNHLDTVCIPLAQQATSWVLQVNGFTINTEKWLVRGMFKFSCWKQRFCSLLQSEDIKPINQMLEYFNE